MGLSIEEAIQKAKEMHAAKPVPLKEIFTKQLAVRLQEQVGKSKQIKSFVTNRFANLYLLSRPMGKQTICIGENKDADQLCGYREADQHLCFRYSDSTMPPLLKSEISSF